MIAVVGDRAWQRLPEKVFSRFDEVRSWLQEA